MKWTELTQLVLVHAISVKLVSIILEQVKTGDVLEDRRYRNSTVSVI